MKISQILEKIDENHLFVPAFQREYVWKRNDAKKLLDSLIKNYPTGTMLTWDTNHPPEFKGKIQYRPEMGTVKVILDGQQRITTLYMIVRGELPPYYSPEEIIQDTRNLYANLETLELSYHQKKMDNNPLWVKLTKIFKNETRSRDITWVLEKAGQEVPRERAYLIDDNFHKITSICDRDFPEQLVPVSATIKEAIDIFYIVNASGVNLTDAELALAQICGYWPKARKELKKKLRELEKHGFVFNLDFLVYILLGVLYNIGSEMSKLHTTDNLDSIKGAWQKLSDHTLDYVMNIMQKSAFIDHTKEINSVYALVPIIVYVYNKGKEPLSGMEIKKIIKWFYYSQIRNRYVSQLPQKLDKDIGVVVRSDNPFDELLSIIKAERPLEISKDEFIGVDIRHPLFGLMRWYFKSKNAVCLSTGVSIRQNMGKKYALERDHIFPYALLSKEGYNKNNRAKYSLAQEITNRAILSQDGNLKNSYPRAEEFLIKASTNFPESLKLQCIPEDRELWKLENFEKFLETRRQMLADELNGFLKGLVESVETSVETPLEALIAEGESQDLEFKSTLRWCLRERKTDKKLEKVTMKSIASFNNGEGGTLLIGVNDEGEIIGLEHDYSILGDSKDGFELHLRELIKKNFGETFATINVKVEFPEIEDKEICQVQIKRGLEPRFLEVADKNGNKSKKFYVRSGNSSIEMPIDEATKYINSRFFRK
ncbi:MAG: DUF262 domain-containing protein [Nitrospinaceae bacterium]